MKFLLLKLTVYCVYMAYIMSEIKQVYNQITELQSNNKMNYRSTGTVHTSAKARLTSIAMRIPIGIRDPDRHQNLIICLVAHCLPCLKISCKPVRKFLRKVANRQTDSQNKQTTTINYISSLTLFTSFS